VTRTSSSLNPGVSSRPYGSLVPVASQGGDEIRYIALIALVFLLTGCASSTATHHVTAAASTTAPGTSTVTDPAGNACASLDNAGYCPGDDPAPAPTPALSCHDPVESYPLYFKSGTTVQTVIAYLDLIATTGSGDLASGNLTSAESRVLDSADGALDGDSRDYAGQLATDSGNYSADEVLYNPATGPTDTTYTQRLEDDIAALVHDCPGAKAQAARMLG
jgi:hypothetical protein